MSREIRYQVNGETLSQGAPETTILLVPEDARPDNGHG